MAMQPGDTLGPYEVLAPIGAGGMGEVYKARDTRLDRTVALKVLPDHIAEREGARARFEREARAVASLSHPNICSLFDIGEGYMVMELIEGETLAQRIDKGPIPLDQALKLATQIADALDRAHRTGVTHRDVKPQNIMLTSKAGSAQRGAPAWRLRTPESGAGWNSLSTAITCAQKNGAISANSGTALMRCSAPEQDRRSGWPRTQTMSVMHSSVP